jgi:hypothetical protein
MNNNAGIGSSNMFHVKKAVILVDIKGIYSSIESDETIFSTEYTFSDMN